MTDAPDESWRGKVGVLNSTDLDEFLAGNSIARLACLDKEGWPYAVPCWQEWSDGAFWLVAREKSRWAEFLENDGRCAITIDEDAGQRKVAAQCRAEIIERPNIGGAWVKIAERMSVRYLGENGVKYLEPTLDKPRWLIRLEPISMQTWQGVDWAQKYK